MSELKVCVYAICKNEAKFVERWMLSMSEADLVVVTDTGSTDDTVKKLKELGASVYKEEVKPWRFDVARNLSLSHVPEDVDICVCTDLDEVLESGWREKLEKAWRDHLPKGDEPVAKAGRYLYNWSFKEDGSPDVQFYNFKVHERKDFQWKYPIHEYVEYVGTRPLDTVFIKGMVLNHYPDPDKSRGSYLPLLKIAVEEAPEDTRMRYYLGREYLYKGEWESCIATLKEYLTMPNAYWNEERCASMRWIAKSYSKLGEVTEAYSWYYKAIAEAPHMRDPYVEFAQFCYEKKDWAMTFYLGKEALKIKEKSTTFVNMGYSWDYTPDDLCAISAYWLNILDESFEHAKRARTFAPKNDRLATNQCMIEVARFTQKLE